MLDDDDGIGGVVFGEQWRFSDVHSGSEACSINRLGSFWRHKQAAKSRVRYESDATG